MHPHSFLPFLSFSTSLLSLSSCAPQVAPSASFSPWAGCPNPSPMPGNTGKMSSQCSQLGPAPAAPSPQPSSSIETVALWYANMYRCNHTDTNLLVWNSTLAAWAQQCGDRCSGHCMGSDAPGVLPGGFIVPYEQIGYSAPPSSNMADAMEAWYIGTGSDSFAAEFSPSGTPTGTDSHGSRVIWRASTQMGCAVSNCPGDANGDSFSVMCHFGNGVSWNQVSKPGTCNPTVQDVVVNLGEPLGHPKASGGNVFPQGYIVPGAGSGGGGGNSLGTTSVAAVTAASTTQTSGTNVQPAASVTSGSSATRTGTGIGTAGGPVPTDTNALSAPPPNGFSTVVSQGSTTSCTGATAWPTQAPARSFGFPPWREEDDDECEWE